MEDFEYVVERKKPAKVCFGSGVERCTDPLFRKGQSPFQLRHTPQMYNTSPATYDLNTTTMAYNILNKVRSKKGVGGLANGALQYPQIHIDQGPTATKYNMRSFPEPVKPNKYGFFFKIGHVPTKHQNVPGPGSYDLHSKKGRTLEFAHSFGGTKTIVPYIEIKCMIRPSDYCEVCKEVCVGDYWHKSYTTYVCLSCMNKRGSRKYKVNPKDYKKIRECSFMHSHEGTAAAVQILSDKILKQKVKLENYLSLYVEDKGFPKLVKPKPIKFSVPQKTRKQNQITKLIADFWLEPVRKQQN